jgi:hypothetical protein
MRTTAHPVFSTPHVWWRVDSALALGAVRVHFVTRADEYRRRAGRASRGWRRFAAAWVWTHHPPGVRAENPRVLVGNPCPVNGLRQTGLPA